MVHCGSLVDSLNELRNTLLGEAYCAASSIPSSTSEDVSCWAEWSSVGLGCPM